MDKWGIAPSGNRRFQLFLINLQLPNLLSKVLVRSHLLMRRKSNEKKSSFLKIIQWILTRIVNHWYHNRRLETHSFQLPTSTPSLNKREHKNKSRHFLIIQCLSWINRSVKINLWRPFWNKKTLTSELTTIITWDLLFWLKFPAIKTMLI